MKSLLYGSTGYSEDSKGAIDFAWKLVNEYTAHQKEQNRLESRTLRSWHIIRSRCNNPKNYGYKSCGAIGVRVCERWDKSFPNFLEDMGPKPRGMKLRRLDKAGDFEPDNCRWEV